MGEAPEQIISSEKGEVDGNGGDGGSGRSSSWRCKGLIDPTNFFQFPFEGWVDLVICLGLSLDRFLNMRNATLTKLKARFFCFLISLLLFAISTSLPARIYEFLSVLFTS